MSLGDEIQLLGNRGMLHFTENIGMAFGIQLAGEYGKLILSIFRIVAVIFLLWYINQLVKKNVSFGAIFSFSLITAGALGNIIDSAFYGMIFSESTPFCPAEMFPADGGYATFLHGKVVDMFYFPLLQGTYPDWFPFWKGQEFIFFRPVFNIADSSITIGVLSLLLFQQKFLNMALHDKKVEVKNQELSSVETDTPPNDTQQ